jgi:hypothetical protein
MTLPGRVLSTISIIACGFSAVHVRAQRGAAAPPATAAMAVSAVVGCVAAEGPNWVLTNASEPILVPAADGKTMTGSGVTVDRAKEEPQGKEKYRLINMLTEFGVPEHKGQRVLVKGLVLGSAKDRRINIVSFEPVAPTCQ